MRGVALQQGEAQVIVATGPDFEEEITGMLWFLPSFLPSQFWILFQLIHPCRRICFVYF